MNALIALLLASATLLAVWRLRRTRLPAPRKVALLALQPLCAVLLYYALLPPPRAGQAGTLVVASADSDARTVAALAGARTVALPEAPALAAVERVPDLATALRRYPGTQRLQIVGAGLPARDRDAASGWPLVYAAPAPVAGLAELSTPPALAPGADFVVTGRVLGLTQARVELRDPAGHRIDHVAVADDGRFLLRGSVRSAGDALFEVRVFDAGGTPRDRATLPVAVAEAPSLLLSLLAGAPQPELKYLRRWAHDAGLAVHSRIAVGGGLQLGDAARPWDVATLARTDLVLLDERALAALERGQRTALREAVVRGLGVLVRIGAPPDAAARAALRELGLPLRGDAAVEAVVLPAVGVAVTDVGATPAVTASALPMLERRLLVPANDAALALAVQADGRAYAWWRALGRGRVGVTTLTDSYRLVLEGRPERHAALWSALLSPLVRAQTPSMQVATPGWRGERLTLCGLGAQTRLYAPDDSVVPLLRDPASGPVACAGVWPRQAGLYRWYDGTRTGRVLVRERRDAPALHANQQRAATLALTAQAMSAPAIRIGTEPGPRWPWWLGFIIVASLSWWLERGRPGGARTGPEPDRHDYSGRGER